MEKISIGLLGFGTVGQGVAKFIQDKADLLSRYAGVEFVIKKVLVKNLNSPRQVKIADHLFTDDYSHIINDDEIDIVVEVISEIEPAREMIVKALENGKSVVTANKGVVSKYFEEFLDLAYSNNLYFLFEASAGGGIPVIKALADVVKQNQVTRVRGIMNGTCNYILSKMSQEPLDYDEVLNEAQELGYAEADPWADVSGMDTLRKLRILSTMAFNQKIVEDDIILEGITKIRAKDIEVLKQMNKTIKLIGDSWIENNKIMALVQPVAVNSSSYFASVADAYNSVTIHGDMVGELKFYGAGAGMLPTANAIVNDIMDIVMERQTKTRYGLGENREVKSHDIHGDFYVRYNPRLVDLGKYRPKEISSNSGLVIVENVSFISLSNELEADSESLIVRLEGDDY